MSKSKALQIQQLKKEKFIDAYKKTNGHITDSASIAGVDRTTYYRWLDDDKDFAMRILDAEADLNDEIRQVLISKAADGDMTAVIFYLKNRHPDFQQRTGVYIKGENMEMAFIDRDGEIIKGTT